MAEYPALPLFTDAYMADTRHLTAIQHGGYLLLLMTAWRMPDCKLPDDDTFLSRCASMDLRTWKANKSIILSFWKKDDEQKWYQGRLLDERKYVDDMRSKNAKAGKASALKRNNRGSTSVQPKSNQNPTPIPTPIIVSQEDKSSFDTTPANVKPETWKAFLEIRKKKKAENSPYALNLLFAKLDKLKSEGYNPQALVEQSIENSWKGIFPKDTPKTSIFQVRTNQAAINADRDKQARKGALVI